jgi:hypothetical protein
MELNRLLKTEISIWAFKFICIYIVKSLFFYGNTENKSIKLEVHKIDLKGRRR